MTKCYCFRLHLNKAKAAHFTCKNEIAANINITSETSSVLQWTEKQSGLNVSMDFRCVLPGYAVTTQQTQKVWYSSKYFFASPFSA